MGPVSQPRDRRIEVRKIHTILPFCALMSFLVLGSRLQAGTFAWPVDSPNPISNSYATYNAVGNSMYHTAFDLTSATGSTTVRAAADGKVRTIPNNTYANENHGMGNVVIIDHNTGRGPFTLYAHLASILVSNGQYVTKGQAIAVMGTTGCAATTGCGAHLHFEVKNWSVLGGLDDDLGPHWGYTPTFPNLWGYMNPWPYMDYDLQYYSGAPVSSMANQSILSGPDPAQYTKVIATVQSQQRFAASSRYGDYYQIYFASDNGPATGWIRAAAISATTWRVNDPIRGLTGVRVRASASTTAAQISSVWDQQWVVELGRTAAGNGCSAAWVQIALASNAPASSGWVCGSYLANP
jgi:hypothetical protein